MDLRVGILGLGNIGGMAARLLGGAGYGVSAVDRPSTQWLAAAGGTLVASAAALAEASDLVIVAVASDAAVEAVYRGADGLVAGARPGLIVADMGTFAVAQKEAVKAALDPTGAVMLDCPISGTPEAMEAGRAVIMISGDAAASETVLPVLEVLAPKSVVVGAFGTGMKLKFVLNGLIGAHILAAAEAMAMGVRSGLAPQQVIDVVSASVATSTQFELRTPIFASRQWQPTSNPARLLHKDMAYIVDHADRLGLAAPTLRAAAANLNALADAGRLGDDLAAMYEALEAESTDAG